MGQQQLLLIVLAVIIVGIAIIVGITIYRTQSIESNRDVITSETLNLAAMAMSYYKKPTNLGGAGNSFLGWTVPNDLQYTEGGTYYAVTAQDSVIIFGTGREVISGTDTVKVKTTVFQNSYVITVLM